MSRTVIWFSAGAASAVTTKLVLGEQPEEVEIVYTDPGNEHSDNKRFINDCEQWFDHSVTVLRNAKYSDCWQVWEETKFLVSPVGARCTTEMKKKLRQRFQRHDDVQVFGYTAEEEHRATRFREQNPEVNLRTPLIERGLTKSDCLAMLDRAGIELPVMYRLGYQNNNCIGCVKGGMGYWNKIRRDFPEVFDRMAKLERDLNVTILRDAGERMFLDELAPDRGNHSDEPSFECSLLCQLSEGDL
jgi:hypothetical protein